MFFFNPTYLLFMAPALILMFVVQWYVKLVTDSACILQVVSGRAVAVFIFPVRHVQCVHVGTCVLEQQCRYRRVDAAGQPHDNALIV